jgi:hypothetical protein
MLGGRPRRVNRADAVSAEPSGAASPSSGHAAAASFLQWAEEESAARSMRLFGRPISLNKVRRHLHIHSKGIVPGGTRIDSASRLSPAMAFAFRM